MRENAGGQPQSRLGCLALGDVDCTRPMISCPWRAGLDLRSNTWPLARWSRSVVSSLPSGEFHPCAGCKRPDRAGVRRYSRIRRRHSGSAAGVRNLPQLGKAVGFMLTMVPARSISRMPSAVASSVARRRAVMSANSFSACWSLPVKRTDHQPAGIGGGSRDGLGGRQQFVGAQIGSFDLVKIRRDTLTDVLPVEDIGQSAFDVGDRPPDQLRRANNRDVESLLRWSSKWPGSTGRPATGFRCRVQAVGGRALASFVALCRCGTTVEVVGDTFARTEIGIGGWRQQRWP